MEPASRDLIRRTASLFSSAMPLDDVLRQFSVLLAEYAEASHIFIDVAYERPFEYAFSDKPATQPGEAVSRIDVPISFGGQAVGMLSVLSRRAEERDADDLTVLESCALYLGSRIHDEAQRADRERLERIAFTDQLTGLANRRAFDEALEREWHRCARSRTPLSLLLLDVDFFKVFNDTYGHVAGDGCLKQIARAVGDCVKRPGDLAARYGGEEFVVILPETAADDAIGIGEHVVSAVRALSLPHHGSSLGISTVSAGCATVVPEANADPASLTELADAQLYRAKELGRNRVAAEAYVSEAPSAERTTDFTHNLPSVRAAFLGREAELGSIAEQLRSHRLSTLAGPGGVGKTRLAIEFGNRSLTNYPDGVWFVDLSSLSDLAFVVPAILAAVGVREEARRDLEETLLNALRDKAALLVLDNCEHVSREASRVVSRLLEACPHLHVLATSREVLSIAGDQVCRVPAFGEREALALFANRARAATATFAMTPHAAEAAKRICRRLDGIPLAIELAAARVRVMTIDELAKRLEERFNVLTFGGKTELARHQTVRALVEWSYNLLEENEKTLLQRLAIFAGDFSLDAATAICAIQPLQQWELLDLLEQLIDKSLVHVDSNEGRYWLLESTKEFGLERLREAGEEAALQTGRVSYLRSSAQSAFEAFVEGAGDRARAGVLADYAEYRAALQWSLSEQNDVAGGAALAGLLGWYWQGGYWREGRQWHELALAHDPQTIGLKVFAIACQGLANMSHARGDYLVMGEAATRAYDAYETLGEPRGQAVARNALAMAAKYAGNFERAYELYGTNARAFSEVGDRRMEAVTLQNLAELVTDWKADYPASEELYEQAVRIHRERGDAFLIGPALGGWSASAAYRGAFERAEVLAGEALEIFRRIGEENYGTEVLLCIAHYRVWAGNAAAAVEPLLEALALLRTKMHEAHIVRFAEMAAELALAFGEEHAAATLFAFGADWRAGKKLVRPRPLQERVESATAAAREALGEAAFAAAAERGRLLYPEAVLDLATGIATSGGKSP